MDLPWMIKALSHPSAYPVAPAGVEVRQTHISVVFLAGPYAYKIKKPVRLGFLDFSTLEQRRHYCEEEARLNRRLAPGVYLGVVPVCLGEGGLKMEGVGEPVEWAVKMQRLADDDTLLSRLRRGEVGEGLVRSLARRVASFHAAAASGERVSAFGRFEVVAGNARENFEQAASQEGVTASESVFERLRALTERHLDHLRPLIEARAARGMPRDTHGDLHLDHVYLFPQREPPGDLAVIDCIEFNERFRFADPVADMAFMHMDLKFHGERGLARVFADAYFEVAGDSDGVALLPFYTAYRAVVRAKVEGFKLAEEEVPEAERRDALARARGHWLLALGELEEPGRRPCLVLAGGLPGTGKSTLARGLAEQAGFRVIRTDEVRKDLAGLPASQSARTGFDEGIYAPEWTERTYAECLSRAERLLFEGERVIVDASFGESRRRGDFLSLAGRMGVPAAFFLCETEPEVARARLAARRGDASDADWAVYQKAAARWEVPDKEAGRFLFRVPADGPPEPALASALAQLREMGLAGTDCAPIPV